MKWNYPKIIPSRKYEESIILVLPSKKDTLASDSMQNGSNIKDNSEENDEKHNHSPKIIKITKHDDKTMKESPID